MALVSPSSINTGLFEIVHRLNPAAAEGEGLGLTIVQKVLERQQGEVRVESAPDAMAALFLFLYPTNEVY